jgi:hypothetical protein
VIGSVAVGAMVVGMLVGVRVGVDVAVGSRFIFVGMRVARALNMVGVGAVVGETLKDHQLVLLPFANVVPEELIALTCQ